MFGFEYYALFKIDPTAFEATDPGIWDFLGYSFNTFMTGSISRIVPKSTPAALLSYMELIGFLFCVLIFTFTFLTVARERYREHLNLCVDQLQLTANSAAQRLEREIQMSLDEAEQFFFESHHVLINALRKMRGSPLITPIEQPPQNDKQETPNPIDANFGSTNNNRELLD